MRSSVEQDPETGLWYWYDETWNRSQTGYSNRNEAVRIQTRYVERVLEGRRWLPDIGDYVWWERPYQPGQTPAQMIRETQASPDDWVVRTLTGSQEDHYVYLDEIEPMNAMEVLAIAHAWPDAIF